MPFFRVDDQIHNHPNVLKAGNAAVGLWVRCGAYSANYLLDGFVPIDVALAYGSKREIEKAIDAGLWRHVAPGGLLIPWAEQYSAEQVRTQRATNAERQRRWKEVHGRSNGVTERRDSRSPKPKPKTKPKTTAAAAADMSAAATLNGDAAAAAEDALALFIAYKVDRDQPRKPDAYRRTLMQDIPGEYNDALDTYTTEHPNASRDDIARAVFGMSIVDIRKASVNQ
jgi:hypothetical protein